MTSAIVENINKRCSCSFTINNVLYSTFQCFETNSDSVTFRGGLQGLVGVNSSVLAGYVVAWVASGDNVTLTGDQYKFHHSDDIVNIKTRCGSECDTTAKTDGTSESLSIGETVGIGASGMTLVKKYTYESTRTG